MSAPASTPNAPSVSTRAQRIRFAIALAVFASWVAGLAVMAVRSEPPRGAALPAEVKKR